MMAKIRVQIGAVVVEVEDDRPIAGAELMEICMTYVTRESTKMRYYVPRPMPASKDKSCELNGGE